VGTSVKLLRWNAFPNAFRMQRGAANTQKLFKANLLMLHFCFNARSLPVRAVSNSDHESLDHYTPLSPYTFVDVVPDNGKPTSRMDRISVQESLSLFNWRRNTTL
jgi:hypothetical protein